MLRQKTGDLNWDNRRNFINNLETEIAGGGGGV